MPAQERRERLTGFWAPQNTFHLMEVRMTGIKRLREHGDKYQERLEGLANDMRAEVYAIADQIEREHAEDAESVAWVRERGGLDSVKKLLDWVVGHCSTKQQLDFDFWLSGRVMHELGFDEDMADRDEVERRLLARLMPDGMEWPRFESGEPVRIGDVVSDVEVRSVVFRDGGILLSDCTSVPGGGTWRSYKEPIKRPTPKVLDADGVEIRVGDTVWHVHDLDKFTVTNPNNGENLSVSCMGEDGNEYCCYPSGLTHRAPVLAADGRPLREGETVYLQDGESFTVDFIRSDGNVAVRELSSGMYLRPERLTHAKPEIDTWQRIEEDKDLNPFDYCKKVGHKLWTFDNAEEFKAGDLVRRCKALAGVSE